MVNQCFGNRVFFVCAVLCCCLCSSSVLAVAPGQAAQWVPIRATVLPDRENYSGSAFYVPPEGSGQVDYRAVAVVLTSHSRKTPLAHALIDCPDGDIEKGLVLKLDFTCTNNFHDDNATTVRFVDKTGASNSSSRSIVKEPVKATIDGVTREVVFHGSYMRSLNSRYLWINLGTALKGSVKVDAGDFEIYFCEADGNTSVNDKTSMAAIQKCSRLGDIVLVPNPATPDDVGHPLAMGLYDSPMVVGDAVYSFTLDDNNVPVAQKLDIPLGKFQLNQQRWRMDITDGRRILFICGDEEPVNIPVGDYNIFRVDVSSYADAEKTKRVSLLADIRSTLALNILRGELCSETLDDVFAPTISCSRESDNALLFKTSDMKIRRNFYGTDVVAAMVELSRLEAADQSEDDNKLAGKVFKRLMTAEDYYGFQAKLLLDRNIPRKFRARLIWPDLPMMRPSPYIIVDLDEMDSASDADGF